jgi:hypothetical protein
VFGTSVGACCKIVGGKIISDCVFKPSKGFIYGMEKFYEM